MMNRLQKFVKSLNNQPEEVDVSGELDRLSRRVNSYAIEFDESALVFHQQTCYECKNGLPCNIKERLNARFSQSARRISRLDRRR